ncbi:uncharacterized protein KIAA1143 homolog [Cololabis saira]|uniref:uncharacterized protein KIAA1143 homolog n=1 Tax=Cololabis saira TaxID=129043 RepID=UPI002AD57CB2|nr:uncharacterized protein KIAA1143 homolog [Cololabis saira]
MSKSKASGVAWVKPAEPTFLKKFKSDVGYKEGPNVDTKRQLMPTLDDDSGSDREDELPQVVVLKSGDLTAEEVKKVKGETGAGGAEKDKEADGKILFKKPAKRSSSDKFQGITASSSKKKKSHDREKEDVEKEEGEKKDGEKKDGEKKDGEKKDGEKKEPKSGKKVKNNSLLSFGGDEDEDDD